MRSSPFRLCPSPRFPRPGHESVAKPSHARACRADFKSDVSNSPFMLNPPAGIGQSSLNDLVKRHGLIISEPASVIAMLEWRLWYRQPRLWTLVRAHSWISPFLRLWTWRRSRQRTQVALAVFMPRSYPERQFPRQFHPIQAAGSRSEKQHAFLRGGCATNLTTTRTA